MCMSCGCNHVHERHKPGDIVLDDLQRAADNHGLSVEQVAQNIQQSARATVRAAADRSGQSAGTSAGGASSTRGTAAEGEGVRADETPNM
jgi:hypothetical protein